MNLTIWLYGRFIEKWYWPLIVWKRPEYKNPTVMCPKIFSRHFPRNSLFYECMSSIADLFIWERYFHNKCNERVNCGIRWVHARHSTWTRITMAKLVGNELAITGYMYVKSRQRSGRLYWDCQKVEAIECSARAVSLRTTRPLESIVVLSGPQTSQHSHPPNQGVVQEVKTTAEAVSYTHLTLPTIYSV